jgi:hypothetical protein
MTKPRSLGDTNIRILMDVYRLLKGDKIDFIRIANNLPHDTPQIVRDLIEAVAAHNMLAAEVIHLVALSQHKQAEDLLEEFMIEQRNKERKQ